MILRILIKSIGFCFTIFELSIRILFYKSGAPSGVFLLGQNGFGDSKSLGNADPSHQPNMALGAV